MSLGTVQRWVHGAGGADLNRVEWTDRPSIPRTFHRTPAEVEARVQDPSFQGALESFNGRWQAKVWSRFHHPSLTVLQARSAAHIVALRQRGTTRAVEAPPRRPFPTPWEFDTGLTPSGHVIFLRRTNALGAVTLLGRAFAVDSHWPHRLVRVEVRLPDGPIRFFALRRRDPHAQPLLREVPYELPKRRLRLRD